jgi:hypothetical protein
VKFGANCGTSLLSCGIVLAITLDEPAQAPPPIATRLDRIALCVQERDESWTGHRAPVKPALPIASAPPPWAGTAGAAAASPAASAPSAAAATSAPTTTSTASRDLHAEAGIGDVFLVEDIERRQADISDLLLIQRHFMVRRDAQRWRLDDRRSGRVGCAACQRQ